MEIGLTGLEKIDMNMVRRLETLKGYVQDSGEGRWMITNAIEMEVPVPTLTTAFFTQVRSRHIEPFPEKMLAVLRNGFGSQAVHR